MNQLLNDRLQKKNALKLSEISVSLSNMSNTVVPMPGIGDETGDGVVVGGFENHLTVLPTKTRPKRIILVSLDPLFSGCNALLFVEALMCSMGKVVLTFFVHFMLLLQVSFELF